MKISERDFEIWNNILSSADSIPDRDIVIRKFNECQKAGMFVSSRGQLKETTDKELPKLWGVVVMAELYSFFNVLEKKYGFDGHKYKIDKTGEIVPVH